MKWHTEVILMLVGATAIILSIIMMASCSSDKVVRPTDPVYDHFQIENTPFDEDECIDWSKPPKKSKGKSQSEPPRKN